MGTLQRLQHRIKAPGSGFLSCFIWKQPGDKFKRDCSTEKNQRDAGEKTELSNVFKKICLGENEDIANAIEVYMQHKFLDLKSLEKYHVAVMELIGELYHFMVNNEMDTTKIPGGIGSLYNELCNLEPQVLQKWLLKFCCMLHDDMADARYHSKKSLIGRAKEYVHDNYQQEDLGLDDICKELGVSNSYFSSMFKKKQGILLSDT